MQEHPSMSIWILLLVVHSWIGDVIYMLNLGGRDM
jgi:hypothetical protein